MGLFCFCRYIPTGYLERNVWRDAYAYYLDMAKRVQSLNKTLFLIDTLNRSNVFR